jgi:hypothetical protein
LACRERREQPGQPEQARPAQAPPHLAPPEQEQPEQARAQVPAHQPRQARLEYRRTEPPLPDQPARPHPAQERQEREQRRQEREPHQQEATHFLGQLLVALQDRSRRGQSQRARMLPAVLLQQAALPEELLPEGR